MKKKSYSLSTAALHSLSKMLQMPSASSSGANKAQSSKTDEAPRTTTVSRLVNDGVTLFEQRRYAKAEKSFEQALQLTPSGNVTATPVKAKNNGRPLSTTKQSPQTQATDTPGGISIDTDSSSSSISSASDTSLLEEGFSFEKQQESDSYNVDGKSNDEASPMHRGKWSGVVVQSAMSSLSLSSPPRQKCSTRPGQTNPTPSPSSKVLESSDKTASSRAAFKHRAEYDEGMNVFAKPLRLDDSSLVNAESTILYNLSRVRHSRGESDKVLELCKRALRGLDDPVTRHDKILTLAILFGIGHNEYVRGNHIEALATYELALSFVRANIGAVSVEAAACLNCVGVLHYIMPEGDSELAIKCLQDSIHLRTRLLGNENHFEIGTSWNNVGRVYFQLADYEQAMMAYKRALKIRRKELGDSLDVGATVFNIGQCLHQLGERDRALNHYREFLRLAKRHFGDFHRDIVIVMTCIGQILHEKKEFEEALKAFKTALRIGRASLGSFHPEIAITLNKMGNLQYESGNLSAALNAYHDGLEVELSVLEPGNQNISVTYTNIAEIHKQRREFDKALENYYKVLNLQRNFCSDTLELANTLSCVAYVLHQKGDYQGSLDINQECLQLRRDALGDIHEDVGSTLTHIALVLLKMDQHAVALEVLSEAYRVRTKITNKSNRDIAFTLYNIALIYHHQGNHETALQFYLETARVEKDALGKGRDLSITFYNIAQLYYQKGELELAVDNFQKALRIERQCFGENHATCARTLNEIGNIHLQLGNMNEMMEAYIEALRIYRRGDGDDDQLVVFGKSLWRLQCVLPHAAAAA